MRVSRSFHLMGGCDVPYVLGHGSNSGAPKTVEEIVAEGREDGKNREGQAAERKKEWRLKGRRRWGFLCGRVSV